MTKCDVLICGGGIAGLALAVCLGRAGLTAGVIEAGPPPAAKGPGLGDGRTVALMGAAMDLVASFAFWPSLKKAAAPLCEMAVVDDARYPAGADSMVGQVFTAREIGRGEFGWNIPARALHAALYGEARGLRGIALHHGARVAALEAGGREAALILEDGRRLSAPLVVGADGRDSKIRQASGIEADRRPYGQTALTCVVGHARPHENRSTEFHRAGGPFTMVPLPGAQSSIVWVERRETAQALLRLPQAAFEHALSLRTRGRLGRINLITPPVGWPLEYLRSKSLIGRRVALMAEAAHVVSPIGAQGLNLSLRDVAALSALLRDGWRAGLDLGAASVLDRYAKARAVDVAIRTRGVDWANLAVASESAALRVLRRAALHALSMPGPWRALVMKRGLAA